MSEQELDDAAKEIARRTGEPEGDVRILLVDLPDVLGVEQLIAAARVMGFSPSSLLAGFRS